MHVLREFGTPCLCVYGRNTPHTPHTRACMNAIIAYIKAYVHAYNSNALMHTYKLEC